MGPDWASAGWEELTPRVGRVRLPGWDCTTGLVVGSRAALLIDTGSSLREGARLRADARALGANVAHIALTHPHFDHVFGTAAFPAATVYGAAGVEQVFATGADELRADAVRYGLDPDDAAEAAETLVTPTESVLGSRTVDLGGIAVRLTNVGPGHTAQSLAVLVPGTPAIVFCGDLVEESDEPQAGPDAVPRQWPAALDRLLELGGAHARYVPGHGAVVDAAFVRAQRTTLATRFGVP
ncbi:MBL fold metallo-hydrolase [Nocardia stercoris]|uniref:MBL fold metallo-hydrolase n=1 Tax=Nocardia stercoris TaxID=2483361 RepID=A0A3M2L5W5_9NOCA|nr:MBL fold metallo-hydrolase [Nocardia stercoris]RMI31275.1 MBL fold metallo-hydrolase [Nocardia stercoris]